MSYWQNNESDEESPAQQKNRGSKPKGGKNQTFKLKASDHSGQQTMVRQGKSDIKQFSAYITNWEDTK